MPSASVPTWQLVFRNTAGSTTAFPLTTPQFTLSGLTNPSSQQVIVADTGTTAQALVREPLATTTVATCTYVFAFSVFGGAVYQCPAFSVRPYDVYIYYAQTPSSPPTAPSPAPSTAATTVPINTATTIQSLALSGIAPPPTFTYNGLTLTWGQAGGSGGGSGGSGGSGGGSNIGLPTYWINNTANSGPTALASGLGGSVTIRQYGGLPPNGCLPFMMLNGNSTGLVLPPSQVLYATELTFSTSGNVLTAGLQVYGGLVFVNSGTLPTGTYYALIAQEGSCQDNIINAPFYQTPLVKSVATGTPPALGQLAPNTPFQALMGSTSITTTNTATYVIEIFYQ